MAEVYWIRLPEHTDVFSQGYVGVTTKTSAARFLEHVSASRWKQKKKLKISNAICKHGGENLVVDTLVFCDIDYALTVEAKLRPEENIGWNLAKGGSRPPIVRGPRPADFCQAISKRTKGVPKTEESKRKASETLTGRNLPEEHKRAISEKVRKKIEEEGINPNSLKALRTGTLNRRVGEMPTPRFWEEFYQKGARKGTIRQRLVEHADELYEIFSNTEGLATAVEVGQSWNKTECRKSLYDNIHPFLRYFRGGWVPLEDSEWVLKFKKEASDGS